MSDRLDPEEHVFHIALAADWAAARVAGDYRVSTLGRTLDEEGFLHASRRHQVDAVRASFYDDPSLDLLLLEIDPARLTSALVLEVPDGADEAFPHVYGPLDLSAVVATSPLR